MSMSSRFTADEAFEAEGDDPIMMTYGAVLRTFRDHGLNDPQDFADFCADCGFNAQVASREYDAAAGNPVARHTAAQLRKTADG